MRATELAAKSSREKEERECATAERRERQGQKKTDVAKDKEIARLTAIVNALMAATAALTCDPDFAPDCWYVAELIRSQEEEVYPSNDRGTKRCRAGAGGPRCQVGGKK